jgi:hypothetical protein
VTSLIQKVSLKVWKEDSVGNMDKEWYKVKNGSDVLKLDLCSGDKLFIDGIGYLEICGLDYESKRTGENPYESLTIICGLIINV